MEEKEIMKNFLKFLNNIFQIVFFIFSLVFLCSFLIALVYNESNMSTSFLFAFITTTILFFASFTVKKTTFLKFSDLKIKYVFLIILISWALICFIGAFPYLFSDIRMSFINAVFESVSLFTTTGITLFEKIEVLPHSLIIYRGFTTWVGGIGIILFLTTIIPNLNKNLTGFLFQDINTLTMQKSFNKTTTAIKTFAFLYFGFSILEMILLTIFGMSPFDAFIHTAGSMSTNGISVYSDGIAHYEKISFEIITIVFSVIASINFIGYIYLLKRDLKSFVKSIELRIFLCVLLLSSIFVGIVIFFDGYYENIFNCILRGFLETSSFMTTSGYVSSHFSSWPNPVMFLFFILMFIGGSSNSTAGGIKVIRIAVLFSVLKRNIVKRLHPNAVVQVRLDKNAVPAKTASDVICFIFIFLITFLVGAILLTFEGESITKAFSDSISVLSNTGTSLTGSPDSVVLDAFSPFGKTVLILLMFAGRIEIISLILPFTKGFWKEKKN